MGPERKNYQSDLGSLTVKARQLRKTAKKILVLMLINTDFFLFLISFHFVAE